MCRSTKKLLSSILALLLIFAYAALVPDRMVSAETYDDAHLFRIGGVDRYDTANKIASTGWTTSPTVVLASGLAYPDALAGAPLAYALDAPILLVSGKKVNDSVMNQIISLGATKIYILGGKAAVSEEIEKELLGKNYTVTRVWGQTRYETAVEVAKSLKGIKGAASSVFVVSGENYPDALSVSPIAALKNAPIVYSNKAGAINDATSSFISELSDAKAYVIGGSAAISDDINTALSSCGVKETKRIFGATRYETSLNVADFFSDVFTTKAIAFATGENYPDALAGGVFASKKGIPVLLTSPKMNADHGSSIFLETAAYDTNLSYAENIVKFIEKFRPETVYAFGGESVLPTKTIGTYFSKTEPVVSPRDEPVVHKNISVTCNVYEKGDNDANGATLSDVKVQLLEKTSETQTAVSDSDDNVPGYKIIAETTTDSTGKAMFTEVIEYGSDKEYAFRFVKEGYKSEIHPLDTKGATEDITSDFRVEKEVKATEYISFTCNVFEELSGEEKGDAVKGVTVQLLEWLSGTNYRELGSKTTDSSGTVVFSGIIEKGDYSVYAIRLTKTDYESRVYTLELPDTSDDIECELLIKRADEKTGSISGTVYLKDDNYSSLLLAEGADVILYDAYENVVGKTKANSKGAYSFTGIEAGEGYFIEASVSIGSAFSRYTLKYSEYVGYAPDEDDDAAGIDVVAGQETKVNVRLSGYGEPVEEPVLTSTLYGTIDVNGEAFKGIVLSLKDSAGNVKYEVTTDSSGKYRIEDIEPGTYYIWVACDNDAYDFDSLYHVNGKETFTIEENKTLNMLIHIEVEPRTQEPGSLYGKITFGDFDAYGDYVVVKLFDELMDNPWDAIDLEANYTTHTDSSGNYRIDDIEPGKYYVYFVNDHSTGDMSDRWFWKQNPSDPSKYSIYRANYVNSITIRSGKSEQYNTSFDLAAFNN